MENLQNPQESFSEESRANQPPLPPSLPPEESHPFKLHITTNYAEMLLRDRERLFDKIAAEEDIDGQVRFFAGFGLAFSVLYGFFLGVYSGIFQMFMGAFKFPILVFGTLCLCLPALYMFNVLLGSKLSFRQTLVMLLVSTYLMTALLAALSPIIFFFMMTTPDKHFVSLLNTASCTIAGVFAVDLMWKGMRHLTIKNGYTPNIHVIQVWSLIYAFVGSQLAWSLRPFIGDKGHFVFFRAIEGNFYTSVFKTLRHVLESLL